MSKPTDYQLISESLSTKGYSVADPDEVPAVAAIALIEWAGDGTATRQLFRSIRSQQPACRCLLALPANRAIVVSALHLAASGYLALPVRESELTDCLSCLEQGDGYWSESLLVLLVPPPVLVYPVGFNRREHELWGHLANGRTNQQLEELMCLSSSRIKNIKTALAQKMQLPNAHQLTMCAVLWSKGSKAESGN